MRNIIIPSLMLLILAVVTACGAQPTQPLPVSTVATQANSQPVTAPTAANSAPAAQVSAASVSFAKDVLPILENSCTSCHGEDQLKAGLDLRTYDGLMAGSSRRKVLTPGNSADSFLVQQVTSGKMPKRGPKLSSAQIQVISDWINTGAANN
jgi:hypothetical protein